MDTPFNTSNTSFLSYTFAFSPSEFDCRPAKAFPISSTFHSSPLSIALLSFLVLSLLLSLFSSLQLVLLVSFLCLALVISQKKQHKSSSPVTFLAPSAWQIQIPPFFYSEGCSERHVPYTDSFYAFRPITHS